MFCKECRQVTESSSKKLSPFITGCNNFKINALVDHENSKHHMLCAEAAKAKRIIPGTSEAEKLLVSMNKAALEKLEILFRTSHSLALHARPFSDFEWMCSLDEAKGLKLGDMYKNRTAAKEFAHYIAEAIRQDQKLKFQEAKYFSIIMDGSTDTSITEQEIVFTKSCHRGEISVAFVGIQSVYKADANGILEALNKCMSLYRDSPEDDWAKKLVCAGTDGASVMIGKHNGLVSKLKHLNPNIQGIHCLAHRLELAFKHAIKEYPLFVKLGTMLNGIYKFYHHSALNRAGLKLAFEALKLSCVLPVRSSGCRWLGHLLKALENFWKGYKSIVAHLESVTQLGKVSETRSKAEGFLKLVKNQSLLQFAHILQDIVSCLCTLSLEFQDSSTTLSDVYFHVTSTKAALERFKTMDGPKTRDGRMIDGEFKEVKLSSSGSSFFNFDNLKQKLLASFLPHIEKIFQDMDEHVLEATKILDLQWLFLESTAQSNVETKLAILVDAFKDVLTASGVEADCIELEYGIFREYTKDCDVLELTWPKVNQFSHHKKYANFLALVDLILSFPTSSADCERGFSRMKHVKTDWRSRLDCQTLSDLLAIQLSKTQEKDFDPKPAISLWMNGKHRRFSTTDKLSSESDSE